MLKRVKAAVITKIMAICANALAITHTTSEMRLKNQQFLSTPILSIMVKSLMIIVIEDIMWSVIHQTGPALGHAGTIVQEGWLQILVVNAFVNPKLAMK